MVNNLNPSLRRVFFSLILIAYFVALLLVNYFQLDFVLIGVFVELLTIPALLSVVIYCGYNFWQGVKGEKSQRPIHWIAVGLLLGCMGMLVWGSP
jgi:uncharacterized membrane-anchored protein